MYYSSASNYLQFFKKKNQFTIILRQNPEKSISYFSKYP